MKSRRLADAMALNARLLKMGGVSITDVPLEPVSFCGCDSRTGVFFGRNRVCNRENALVGRRDGPQRAPVEDGGCVDRGRDFRSGVFLLMRLSNRFFFWT